jgi:copper transport protein
MSGRLLLGVPATAAVMLLVCTPSPALAHALAQSSVPADGSTVRSSPAFVTVSFGEEPDPALSSLTVIDTSGRSWTDGPTQPVPGNPVALRVPLKRLPDGVYTVTWRSVSSVDGHLASGAFAFGVGVAPGTSALHTASSYGAAPPGAGAIVGRLLLYAGLVTVVGAALLGSVAFDEPPRVMRGVIATGCVAGCAGAFIVVGAQIQAAGIGLGSVLGSSLGRSLLERGVPAVLLLVTGVLLLTGRRWRPFSAAAAVLALAGMAVDVLFSHAAAESPVALNEFAQALHIAAVGVWVGGLIALLAVMLRAPADRREQASRTLSFVAGIGIVAVAATGVFRAVIEVQTWHSLVSTAFGALVLLKVGLLLILAALGALNRFRNLARLPTALAPLRRAVSAEVLAGVAALTTAAALVNVSPPVASPAAAAAAQPVVATGSDFGTTVKVRLELSPGDAGVNDFRLLLTDYDTGRPVSASQVTLTFTLPDQSIIGSSTLSLRRSGDGVYSGRGGNLAIAGTWQVLVLIQRGAGSVDVPLRLITHSPPPQVTKVVFAGEPTLYNVHLPAGGVVQVYIDPDRPGPVEFHMTFLDAHSQQEQISSAAATETPSGGSAHNLAVRRLDTGHFVADATVNAAGARFDMIATGPGGTVISTYIVLKPAS